MSENKPCTHTSWLTPLTLAIALAGPVGCDSDEHPTSENRSNIAKAFAPAADDDDKRKAEEAELAAALADRRQREEAAQAELKAKIAGIAEATESPKNRSDKQRCNDVADAYDRFTKRRYAEDAKNLMLWYERRRARRAEVRERCRRMPSLTMDCYERTLDGAEGDLLELEDRLLKHCISNHGGSEVLPATAEGTPA